MENSNWWQTAIEAHKANFPIICIISLTTMDTSGLAGKPVETRRNLADAHYAKLKAPLLKWLAERKGRNRGEVTDPLAGTNLCIIAGSYTFWQAFKAALESGHPAFTAIKRVVGNDTTAVEFSAAGAAT